MATYLMSGKYSIDALAKISAARTKNANEMIGDCGGVLKSAYALLGGQISSWLLSSRGPEKAMKASVSLAKQLGITFKTEPAVSVEEFDKLITGK